MTENDNNISYSNDRKLKKKRKTWCRQGPRKPSSCTIITLNSHWGRAATGKKCLASMRAGSLQWWPTLCNPVDCGRPGFSVREGVLQARILECFLYGCICVCIYSVTLSIAVINVCLYIGLLHFCGVFLFFFFFFHFFLFFFL